MLVLRLIQWKWLNLPVLCSDINIHCRLLLCFSELLGWESDISSCSISLYINLTLFSQKMKNLMRIQFRLVTRPDPPHV